MYPGSPIHQFDKLDYEETCHDLDIEETESDNETNEIRGGYKSFHFVEDHPCRICGEWHNEKICPERDTSHLNQPEPNKADPKPIPTSFSEWLEQNRDSIDIGGNWTPDRIQANQDQYRDF
jgi:hypothetical protein